MVRAVWDWPPGPSGRPIRETILKLKRFPQASLVHWHSVQMAIALSGLASMLAEDPEWVLVYPPKGRTRRFNLAEELARSLGGLIGSKPLVNPFVKAAGSEEDASLDQKKKSALGRQQIRYSLRDEQIVKNTQRGGRLQVFVFIDDVFATGATARAAFHALGAPSHFVVLCIAARLSGPSLGGQRKGL